MLFYLAILVILLVNAFIEITYSRKNKYTGIFYALIIVLYVLSFLRWETGTDWGNYYEMFTWIKEPWANMASTGMELGFVFVNHLGKFLFDSYTGVLFIFSTILYFCLSRSYVILSFYPITALFIAFCISPFAHMLYVRQNVALAILCLSVVYVKNRQLIVFLFLVFLASLFHRTAWIFLIVYPLFYKEFSFKFYIISIIASILIGITIGKTLVGVLGNLPIEAISSRIDQYLEMGSADNSTTFSTSAIIIKGFINRGFLLVFLFYCQYKLKYKDSFIRGLMNIYIVGTIIYFITLPLSISLARAAVYMDSIQTILIPCIIYKQHNRYNRMLLLGIICLYYSLRFYSALFTFWDCYIPFKTIFVP